MKTRLENLIGKSVKLNNYLKEPEKYQNIREMATTETLDQKNINFPTKKVMIDNGSDFPVEFYIELYKRYPNDKSFWEEVTIDFTIRDGKYHDASESDSEFTFSLAEVCYGCHCLYRIYEYREYEHILRELDIYFIDKLDQKKYTTKNVKEYLNNPHCISLCEELGLNYIYEIPSYIDDIKYNKRWCKYEASIDKNKIIANLLRIIRNFGICPPLEGLIADTDYSATRILLGDKRLGINDLEEDMKNCIKKMNEEPFIKK